MVAQFSRSSIFKDIDSLEPGEDFIEVVERTIRSCEFLLVLIGKNWLNAKDDKGELRLGAPDDPVTSEICAALDAKVRVIPLLLGGARMPSRDSLPERLKPIHRITAMEIPDALFHQRVDILIRIIAEAEDARPSSTSPKGEAPGVTRKKPAAKHQSPTRGISPNNPRRNKPAENYESSIEGFPPSKSVPEVESWAKRYAEVASRPGVFVLGCFARHATLYSQQVRALNLIYELHSTGKVKERSQIAVIGAGAGGLAAAGGLARKGCEVTVFERCQNVLALQANAVHRRLHPHIYDWPANDASDSQAHLPIFDWEADSADRVVDRLRGSWESLKRHEEIEAHFSVEILDLFHDTSARKHIISWKEFDENPKQRSFDILVLALGQGTEPEWKYGRSYWSPDNLDDCFDGRRKNERWLISGLGDSAFADLMRVCVANFRCEDVVRVLESTDGINGIKEELNRINARSDVSNAELSRQFSNISTGQLASGKLEDRLAQMLNKTAPHVFLTGTTPYLYGRGSSVLNRFIVLLLSRLGAFTFLPGPSGQVNPHGDRYRVNFDNQSLQVFDRVILRHGTASSIIDFMRRFIGPHSSAELQQVWSQEAPDRDPSRWPKWPLGFFDRRVKAR